MFLRVEQLATLIVAITMPAMKAASNYGWRTAVVSKTSGNMQSFANWGDDFVRSFYNFLHGVSSTAQ